MKGNRQAGRPVGQVGFLPRLVLLASFFAVGIVAGWLASKRVDAAVCEEIRRYLTDFLRLEESRTAGALLSAALTYVRYPLLAVLLGFTAAGIVLLPCAAAVFGGSLSFSACCFTMSFGARGILLALTVFGLRCLVTLPCFFLLAAHGWSASAALAGLSFGRGKRAAGGSIWPLLGGVAAVLAAGICVEWSLLPWLVRAVLARVLV
ncbi:MAG: hypothetical protein IJ396_05405 [Oscillibacter sp.]|nr:hypothetical protein [Oscillibacter sp.]